METEIERSRNTRRVLTTARGQHLKMAELARKRFVVKVGKEILFVQNQMICSIMSRILIHFATYKLELIHIYRNVCIKYTYIYRERNVCIKIYIYIYIYIYIKYRFLS